MRLREQYKKETGKMAIQYGGVPELEYVKWLEKQIKTKDRLMKLVLDGKQSKDDILDYNLKRIGEES